MFAVIRTGGKQYKVAKNDVIVVEKLSAEPGGQVRLGEVLALGDTDGQTFGTPLVAGASVTATVLEQKRGEKILVFKKKRRQNYRRQRGHRQHLTVLRITDIVSGAAKPAAAKAKPEATPAEAKPAKETTAGTKAAAPKAEAGKSAAAKPAAKKPAAKKAAVKPAAKGQAAKPAARKPAAKKAAAKSAPKGEKKPKGRKDT